MRDVCTDTIVDSKFRIVQLIASGGMGSVYEAEQIGLNRFVAIKFLLPELLFNRDNELARFQREAELMCRLRHRNIVSFYTFGLWNEQFPYLTMELISGSALDTIIEENECLSIKQTLLIALDICDGLQHAHSKGIIHRDLKPSNVFILEGGLAKIADFGLAKMLTREHNSQKLTATGFTLGTPMYASPEQLCGDEVREPSDLYSLGCLMYESIFGKPPYDGDTPMEIAYKHANESVPLKHHVSKSKLEEATIEILRRALAKKAEDRYQSASEMRTAIRKVLDLYGNQSESQKVVPKAEPAWTRLSWPRIPKFALLFILAAVGTAGTVVVLNKTKTEKASVPIARRERRVPLVSENYYYNFDEGHSLLERGLNDDAIRLFEKAVDISTKRGTVDELHKAKLALASAYCRKKRFDDAVSVSSSVLNQLEKEPYNEKYSMALYYTGLGYKEKDPRKALEYFFKEIDYQRAHKQSSWRLRNSTYEAAQCYALLNEHERAIKWAKQSLIFTPKECDSWETKRFLANCYRIVKNYKEGIPLLVTSLEEMPPADNFHNIAERLPFEADLYLLYVQSKDFGAARSVSEIAMKEIDQFPRELGANRVRFMLTDAGGAEPL